jgi:hypothetical protein
MGIERYGSNFRTVPAAAQWVISPAKPGDRRPTGPSVAHGLVPVFAKKDVYQSRINCVVDKSIRGDRPAVATMTRTAAAANLLERNAATARTNGRGRWIPGPPRRRKP